MGDKTGFGFGWYRLGGGGCVRRVWLGCVPLVAGVVGGERRFRVEMGSFGGCGDVGRGLDGFGCDVVVETPVGAGCSEAGGGGVGSG